jgi:tRNA(Ile2) C34 agmatinyltransferase TiaS
MLNQLKPDRPQCCDRAMNSKGAQWRCPLCHKTKSKNPQKRGGSERGQGRKFSELLDRPSHCGLPMISNGSNWLCKVCGVSVSK